MTPDEFADLSRDGLIALVRDATAEILSHQDAQRFLAWMVEHAAGYLGAALAESPDEGAQRAIATVLGRGIWNATPLPDNDFRPRALPEPGRNDPCPCGSGRKYKRCCAIVEDLPKPELDEVWLVAVEHFSEAQLAQAIARNRVPPAALAERAMRHLDDDDPKRARALLEPLFAGPADKLDDRYEPALDALCDIYLELGHDRKKIALLERVGREGSGELKSAALQRLATAQLDAGERDQAWTAFQEAQRHDPNHPALGSLEVTLLIAQGRREEAIARARFWIARLRRQGAEYPEVINHLERFARDPLGAMGEAEAMQGASPEFKRLKRWIEAQAGRALPLYRAVAQAQIEPGDTEALRSLIADHLRGMGVNPESIERETQRMANRIQREQEDRTRQPELSAPQPDTEPPWESDAALTLASPDELGPLEAQWHKDFPLPKPVLTEDLPRSDHDPWVPKATESWLTFLERNPAAFDSIDVLDDLGAALNVLREEGLYWSTDALVEALGRRCAGILDRALTDAPAGSHLSWAMPQNRAALRMESRLGMALISTGRAAEAFEQEMRLLRLNPGDNHGIRASVMNRLLSAGRDDEAVALAERYPDDGIVEVAYGRVLALYRLDRHADALAALETARKMSPKVVDYLVSRRVRKPKLNGHYVSYGGDDEAWYYREHMREIWAAVPGLLAWLKQPVTAKR